MSLGLISFDSWSDTRVDSAEDGTHDDCSLFFTSASLLPRPLITTAMRMTATNTIHLVTGEVSLPTIWRCMGLLHQKVGTVGIGVSPESARWTAPACRTHRRRGFLKSDRSPERSGPVSAIES